MRDRRHDVAAHTLGILVLPEAHHLPTSGLECCRMPSVTFSVPGDLWHPVVRVLHVGAPAMCGASVPEAAVHENADPGAREDDVRADQPLALNPDGMIDAKSQAVRMQQRPDASFHRRVPAANRGHVS